MDFSVYSLKMTLGLPRDSRWVCPGDPEQSRGCQLQDISSCPSSPTILKTVLCIIPSTEETGQGCSDQALTPGSDPKSFLEMLAWKCLVMQGRFPSRKHMTISPTWFLVCDPRRHYTPKFTVGQREAKGLAREAGISERTKPHLRPKIEDQRDEEGLPQ